MSPCAECGFTYLELPRRELADRVNGYGPLYASRLVSATGDLRTRPTPVEWSPLEYACHVRDVALMQRDRLYVALVEDGPSFKPMYRDQRVEFDRYDRQEPETVANQLAMATSMLANAFDPLTNEQWTRPLIYGYPEAARRDVEWMAHHTLHELVHHLSDIDRILSRT
jgi:hypothetical protein